MFRVLLLAALLFAAPKGYAQQRLFTLGDIWQKALVYHPSLQARRANIRHLEANRDLVKTRRLPHLQLQAQQNFGSHENLPGSFFPLPGNFNVSGTPKDPAQPDGSSAYGLYGSSLLDLPVYRFGRLNREIGAADAAVDVGTSGLREEEFRLKMKTARLYFGALHQMALLQVVRREEERFRELLEHTREQAIAGLIQGADTSLLRAALLSARATRQDVLARLQAELEDLGAFTGTAFQKDDLDTSVFYREPRHLSGEPGGEHPVLRRLLMQEKQAEAVYRAEKAQIFPSIHVLAGAGAKGASAYGGANSGKALDEVRGFYLAGIGLTWNLSSIYEAPHRRRRAAGSMEEAEFNRQAAVLEFQSALNTALQNVERMRVKRQQAEEALRLATDAFESYSARYENGLIDMIGLLQIRREVEEAEKKRIDAIASQNNEILRVAGAAGNPELLPAFFQP